MPPQPSKRIRVACHLQQIQIRTRVNAKIGWPRAFDRVAHWRGRIGSRGLIYPHFVLPIVTLLIQRLDLLWYHAVPIPRGTTRWTWKTLFSYSSRRLAQSSLSKKKILNFVHGVFTAVYNWMAWVGLCAFYLFSIHIETFISASQTKNLRNSAFGLLISFGNILEYPLVVNTMTRGVISSNRRSDETGDTLS